MKFNDKERQLALNYTVYMIASSYFASASVLTRQRASRGHLLYVLQLAADQYRMEESMIALMEKQILPLLPSSFLRAPVKVRFLDSDHGVRITALGYMLEILPRFRERSLSFDALFRDLPEGTCVFWEEKPYRHRRKDPA